MSRLAAIAVGLSITSLVCAQEREMNPWYVRLGVTFPTSKDVRDNVSKTGFGVGLGYRLSNKPFLSETAMPAAEFLYFHSGGNGGHINTYAFQYTERFMFDQDKEDGLYAGVGLGVQYSDVKFTSGNIGGSGGLVTVDEGRFNIAGELMLGYRFNKQFAVEAGLRLSPKVSGVDTNSFSVMANFKF